jgi:hypothetical protein
VVFGLTAGVGMVGWVLGAVFTRKNRREGQDVPGGSRR